VNNKLVDTAGWLKVPVRLGFCRRAFSLSLRELADGEKNLIVICARLELSFMSLESQCIPTCSRSIMMRIDSVTGTPPSSSSTGSSPEGTCVASACEEHF